MHIGRRARQLVDTAFALGGIVGLAVARAGDWIAHRHDNRRPYP